MKCIKFKFLEKHSNFLDRNSENLPFFRQLHTIDPGEMGVMLREKKVEE